MIVATANFALWPTTIVSSTIAAECIDLLIEDNDLFSVSDVLEVVESSLQSESVLHYQKCVIALCSTWRNNR